MGSHYHSCPWGDPMSYRQAQKMLDDSQICYESYFLCVFLVKMKEKETVVSTEDKWLTSLNHDRFHSKLHSKLLAPVIYFAD